MDSLLAQMRARRRAMSLNQKDMATRLGMSRQQYQRLESRGNPRLSTLELLSRGLNCDLLLVPRDRMGAVLDVLEPVRRRDALTDADHDRRSSIVDDPWQGLLDDLEDDPEAEPN